MVAGRLHADQGGSDKCRRHRRDQIGVEQRRKVGTKQVLHDVGGVRADHDQLAVRHVDHAHQAVRDREAERGQQQDGAERDAAEDAADHFTGG